ncbi:tail fiber protein [Campylobacter sp. RM12920]|uniref:Tail fiber protein n=1 Tax=Campylobacter californiensis TaxID=1032243 RepID=A0ABD4JIS6_9BACT|nr:tail fiber protein [Campylobacter sp. RM12919]MBE2988875.1 tail fiber protein [Campylobacter sp. RM12920]
MNLTEKAEWTDGIYQLETTDPVVGGADGVSNKQAKQLANRTAYLKAEVLKLLEQLNSANNALNSKRDITDSYNKIEVNALLDTKLDITATAADSLKLGGVKAERYALKSEISDGLKIGSYLLWSSESVTPSGFLVCDGRTLAKAEYAELFNVIGYTYGGSGESFNIPTFNDGRFMRSIGGNAARLGELQTDEIKSHLHTIPGQVLAFYAAGNGIAVAYGATNTNGNTETKTYGGNETRPLNSSVVVLIKAKDVKEPNSGQIDNSIYATEAKAGITKLKNSITGNATDTAVTEKAVKEAIEANKSIGVNQTWQDMTSQRKQGITYTNTTGRSISVSIRTSALTGSCGGYLTVDKKIIQYFATSQSEIITLYGIIPPGSTYSATVNTGTIPLWFELR